MTPARVLLVDDHALFREGMVSIIAAQPDLEVVGEAEDGLEALVKAQELRPDLVLLDIQMPGMDGLEACRQIKKDRPETVVVMLTVRDDDDKLFQAIRAGAQGYLLKSTRSKEVLEMLRGALRGEAAIPPQLAGRMLEEFRRLSLAAQPAGEPVELTQREQEILGLVAQGLSDKQIAAQLSLSLHTVKTHLRNILSKLQVESRHAAAQAAQRKGLI